ncbi:DUF1211 domain-containing protein [Streptacidiphilus sp. PB12-B1b]|uniref:TMEM175 family protein n=1 Tax=Streptacidiphilus sp. PB12-B1b TaxID=2705012 RepID=UPI0015FD510C|nr:TMEM175 family protein [Streptacidiphilus sp. PB12-B1b]QMU78601.1 DUF1211 domain-containing protein [Streptacidiphilus sp. PB12-B1b]
MSTLTEEQVNERETGRLFGLSDGVFAIAMTLLALDLQVPDLPSGHASDHALTKALLALGPRYLAFGLSFYVIAGYWRRHNAEMRTVHAGHPALLARTIPLLLLVCTLPFATGLLGRYGSQDGIAIAVYAGVNILATVSLLLIRHEARLRGLSRDARPHPSELEIWFDLVALVLAVPSGYLFPRHGIVVLVVLMVISGIAGALTTRHRTTPTTDAPETVPAPAA